MFQHYSNPNLADFELCYNTIHMIFEHCNNVHTALLMDDVIKYQISSSKIIYSTHLAKMFYNIV